MTSRWGRKLRDPLFLLCLTAGLLAFVVQSGEVGTADTMHRLQTTHWIWTSQPQVFPNEYPEFGLQGRGGRIFSWYGIGQSLLMLPSDIAATWIASWHIFSEYEDDPAVRSIIVSYTTNILLSVLTVLIAFRLLRQLRFSVNEAVLGILSLLFLTTHLHYTQNMQENNYIMLLTLTGFSFQYEWLRGGNVRALLLGSAALGLNLLTRVTTGLDLMAAGFFLLALLWFEHAHGRTLWERAVTYCKVSAPIYAFFAIIERLYNFYRFGSLTQTYIPIFARESRLQDPTLPANFPWSTPFHEGVLGALFKPEKSIFMFDPMLVLALVLLVLLWKRLDAEVRAYAVASLLLLGGYICFYARYTYWAGDFAWGDRYVSTAVEMVALVAVPLLVRFRATLSPWIWRGAILLHGGQLRNPSRIAGVLVATRDLPDGDAGPSYVRDCATLQEHRRLHARQNGCLGVEHGRHVLRSVGLRPHYDMEFLPLPPASGGSCTGMGCGDGVCRVGCRSRRAMLHVVAVAKPAHRSGRPG